MTEETDTDLPVRGTRTHPHVAVVTIDPVDWSDFEAAAEGRPEMKIRKLDRGQPDVWVVYVACASEKVRDRLEENW